MSSCRTYAEYFTESVYAYTRFNIRMRKQSLYLGGKNQFAVLHCVKKRFYTRPIPCKHEGIISAVPNRKGKYTVQIVNAPRTILHIQKQYYLCVTSGFKFISQRFQAECKLAGVVDLSVKYYYVLCAIARFYHRLSAA